MSSVHIGVGHDDDPVIAKLRWVEGTGVLLLVPNTGTQCLDDGLDLLILEDLRRIVQLAFDVEDLPPQGKDGLRPSVTSGLRRAACGIPLDEVDLALLGRPRLTISELPGETSTLEDAFPLGQFLGFLGSSRARFASKALSMMVRAMPGCSSRKVERCWVTMPSTNALTS